MDITTLNLLQKADWDDILPRLCLFTKKLIRLKGITRLPGGQNAEDVCGEAINAVFDGKRAWNPERYPILLEHLKWIVRSLLSDKGLLGRKENDVMVPGDPEAFGDAVASESGVPAPSEEAVDFKVALMREVGGDKELQDLITAIEMDFEKPRDIAEMTGIKVERVYELRRKLYSFAKRVAPTNGVGRQTGGRT